MAFSKADGLMSLQMAQTSRSTGFSNVQLKQLQDILVSRRGKRKKKEKTIPMVIFFQGRKKSSKLMLIEIRRGLFECACAIRFPIFDRKFRLLLK